MKFRRHQPTVVLYTRDGCGLCERAEQLIRSETGRTRCEIVDIDQDPMLRDRYDVRVPVVSVDGIEIAAFELAPGVVRGAVAKARQRRRWNRQTQ